MQIELFEQALAELDGVVGLPQGFDRAGDQRQTHRPPAGFARPHPSAAADCLSRSASHQARISASGRAAQMLATSSAATKAMARPDCSAASNRSASSSRPSRRKPIRAANSCKFLLLTGRFFAASL